MTPSTYNSGVNALGGNSKAAGLFGVKHQTVWKRKMGLSPVDDEAAITLRYWLCVQDVINNRNLRPEQVRKKLLDIGKVKDENL